MKRKSCFTYHCKSHFTFFSFFGETAPDVHKGRSKLHIEEVFQCS